MRNPLIPFEAIVHEAQPVGALREIGRRAGAPTTKLSVMCDLGYDDTLCQTMAYSDGGVDVRFQSRAATSLWAWLQGL